MKLKVDSASQRNPLYSWRRLGNTWSSVYFYGCYFISLWMLLRFKGFIYSVPELLSTLKKNGGFEKDMINPVGVLKILGPAWKYERKDWELTPANMGVIQELIDSKYPVIAKVDFNPNTKNVEGHFVLLTGYVIKAGKLVDLVANDPWSGKEILVCEKYPYLKTHTPQQAILGVRIYRLK